MCSAAAQPCVVFCEAIKRANVEVNKIGAVQLAARVKSQVSADADVHELAGVDVR